MGHVVTFRCDVCQELADPVPYDDHEEVLWEENPDWWVAGDGSETFCPACARLQGLG